MPIKTSILSTDEKYTLEDAYNNYCIMVAAYIYVEITYVDKYNETNFAIVDVPPKANVSGDCLQGFINLTWNNPTVPKANSLELWFRRNSTHFFLRRIVANIFQDPKFFPNITNSPHYEKFEADFYDFLATPIGRSYSCDEIEILWEWTVMFWGRFDMLQIEAFREGPLGRRAFSPALKCGTKFPPRPASSSMGEWTFVGVVIVLMISTGMSVYFIRRRYWKNY
ncbi:Lysosome-associated membrane glycoprotein 1 [Folsomia candida]|uniref:Lysosome-associated membrane glycoprotein 5 n=2 Tax=Folsomia candida TaxID=158441 RepID=A0A226DIG2_FOLCA|nr:Lysosome-associated membrane glycoprotein 1 [Folsomia candida]